jgi:hypothetical protein
MTLVKEHLPTKPKALSSNPRTTKKQTRVVGWFLCPDPVLGTGGTPVNTTGGGNLVGGGEKAISKINQ